MKYKYIEPLISLGIGLTLVTLTSFVINTIENRNIEKKLVKEWNDKGAECLEEPRTTANVSKGKFKFECPVKEETVEQKAFRELPSDRFDIERTQDLDYLLTYLKNNPPTYDCALLDKYAKPNIPCWDGYFKWGGMEYRTLLFNSKDYFDSLSI